MSISCTVDRAELRTAIERALAFVDPAARFLHCIGVVPQGEELDVVGTDSVTLCLTRLPASSSGKKPTEMGVSVHHEEAEQLRQAISGEGSIEVELDEESVRLGSGQKRISVPVDEPTFIDYSVVFVSSMDANIDSTADRLRTALQKLGPWETSTEAQQDEPKSADEPQNAITFKVREDGVHITRASQSHHLEADVSGEPVTISLNGRWLLRFLNLLEPERPVRINLSEGRKEARDPHVSLEAGPVQFVIAARK